MMTKAVMMNRETNVDATTAWEQLTGRDPDGQFFYAVTTTGVFCRPDCTSRLPLRENVRFYTTPGEAKAAGFRACMRCKPEEPRRASPAARMCAYLEREIDRHVRLETLGRLLGISPYSAQRIFKKAMGVSPAEYQRAMRAHGLRSQLRDGGTDVTTAIYEAGYGSASRAYEMQPLGMTPGRFLAGGRGEKIGYATAETIQTGVAGWVVVGATERGICWLALGDTREAVETSLRTEFPAAEITSDSKLQESVSAVLRRMRGERQNEALPLDLRGTAFQLRVWKALQEIPVGVTKTYGQLAAEMGMPKSTRAVARACATNRVSVLVPCHRVVGASGSLTGYRWGVERKRELLAIERH